MMHEAELDPRIVDWLRDGPPGASSWVLEGIVDHVATHPRRPLRARWRELVGTLQPGSGALPALRPLLIAGAALAIVGGGLIYAGSQGLFTGPVSPTPALAPSATPTDSPSPSAATWDPVKTIAANHEAWHSGRIAEIPRLYTDDHAVVLVRAGPIDDDAHRLTGPQHFEIRPGLRNAWIDWWVPSGMPVGQGAYWEEPFVAGVWDPGTHGFAIYRFAPDGRIRTLWAIVAPTTSVSSNVELRAGPPDGETQDFLDGCLTALDAADGAPFAACFGDDSDGKATWHVSADGAGGAWTAEYDGRDAISDAARSTAYGGRSTTYPEIERTGPMRMIEDMVAYPFAASAVASQTCQEGINVIRLTARGRIAEQWTFCAPNAGEIVTMPPTLQGTWNSGSTVLELHACGVGEPCGRFERVDDNRAHCVYELLYQWGDASGIRLWSDLIAEETTDPMSCAWSGWWHATYRVTVESPDRLSVQAGTRRADLYRATSAEPGGSSVPQP